MLTPADCCSAQEREHRLENAMSDVAGNRSGWHNILPDVWRLSVDASQSERDLVDAVRDYLATWTPDEVSQLPAPCRPGRITSGEDIADMAFRLQQFHIQFDGSAAERQMLERLMGLFLHASSRFAQLVAEHRTPFTATDG